MHIFTAADIDLAWLQRLRHFTYQIDIEQAVFHLCAGHLDVIGELEALLEITCGDTAVQEIPAYLPSVCDR